eukprot:Gb_21985 [translate_table: standard]
MNMEPEEEVHLGVFCLHMSSDSEDELSCLGVRRANDNNGGKAGSPPANFHGVASRTRRAKDKMNGFVQKHSGYRCSCCDLNAPKEKDGTYLNKASSGYIQGESDEVEQANVDPHSPGKGLKSSSPTLKRAPWKPRDEIEIASAVLDGLNSGFDGIKNVDALLSVKSHDKFWEQIRKNVEKNTGEVRSKYQIIEKFRKMKRTYLANAVVRSDDGHQMQLNGILQQIFSNENQARVSLGDIQQTLSEDAVNGNEAQVSQPRTRNKINNQKASQGVEVNEESSGFNQVIPAANEGEQQGNADPGSLGEALWKPSDEIVIASTVLDGMSFGIGGVKSGADVMSVKSHDQFWEQISKKVQKKTGETRSKYQIIEKFISMKRSYVANAMQQSSVVQSNNGHKEQLFGIFQKIFADEKEPWCSLHDTATISLEDAVNRTKDNVSQPRTRRNITNQKANERVELNNGSLVSRDSLQDETIHTMNGAVGQVNVDLESLGECLSSSTALRRAMWKPKDEIEIVCAILDGINSGIDGVENGVDFMSVKAHDKFWEQISKKVHRKTGKVRSKYQIFEKFRKMKRTYVANATQQSSVVPSNDGHKEHIFCIFQQIFGNEKERLNFHETPVEDVVNGNEEQVSEPRSMSGIVSQKASQDFERAYGGDSFILCLPCPNQPNTLKHPDHTTQILAEEIPSLQVSSRSRSAKRKFQDEMAVGPKALETNLSPLVSAQRKLAEALENSPCLSSPVYPRRKSTKRTFEDKITAAAVNSKDTQSSKRTKSANQTSQSALKCPAQTSKHNLSSQASLKMKLAEWTSQNEIGSVDQIPKENMFSHVELKRKTIKWTPHDEMLIAKSVLDAIESGLLGEKLGSDFTSKKHSKLWEIVQKQIQGKTEKECTIDQVYTKFMKMRTKFLDISKKQRKKCKIQLSDHEKELFKTFQVILCTKQRDLPTFSGKETQRSETSRDLQQASQQMNVSECFESVPFPTTSNEVQEELRAQMELPTARANLDGLIDMKQLREKCKELRDETRAICMEIWQGCEQKFQDMQSKLIEMLETKMNELKGSQSDKGRCLSGRELFLGEASCDGQDENRRMHLMMERRLEHRSRKLQLMQEFCRIEKEELETEYLARKLKAC